MSICLVCDLALWPPALQFQLPALLFVFVVVVLFLLFLVVLSGEPKTELRARAGRPQTSSPPPPTSPLPPSPQCNFTAGRPKAALLFRSFGDFRCGVLLFIVILVILMNIEIGKKYM